MKYDCPAACGSRASTASRRLACLIGSATLVLGTLTSPASAGAQGTGGRSEVFAGSELESYLRYLQTVGKSSPSVWSLRGLSPREVDAVAPADTLHPWRRRYDLDRRPTARFEWDIVAPTAGFLLNTSYPFGSNDGPVWAGKGFTGWGQAGIAIRMGVMSAKLAPIAFRATNAAFPLMPNGQVGTTAFADGQFPLAIDRPQRFGDTPYGRVDPGESMVRLDVAGVAAGISTESQWWGPTVEFPYVLGNNAGGFPHAFFGSSRPANVGFGRIHGRVLYGLLNQSRFSPVVGSEYFESVDSPGRKRFMAGLIGALQIRGIPGLEIGGARFFHSALDSSGVTAADLKLPFQNPLKSRIRAEGDTLFGDDRSLFENQLASVFFRWAPPRSGMELYGEYGREDFSADVRDFLLEPDHSSTINVGFRKAWLRPDGRSMQALRAEFFSYAVPAGTRTRGEGRIYLHIPLLQGHTLRGQMLGANTGVGSGSAQMIAFDRFTTRGRMKGFVSRVTQRELSTQLPGYTSGPALTNTADIQYSVGAEMSRFLASFDVTARLVLTSEPNRNFDSGKSNANFGLILRQDF